MTQPLAGLPPQPHPGDALVAGCRLLRMVGSGGEGEVWDAVGPEGERCALKLIRPVALLAPHEAARRGQWLVRIAHPSLVRVRRGGLINRGDYAGWGYVAMDFVDGESLADAPVMPDAARQLWGVAEALDLLHAGRWSDGVPLVHRDVKPANLVASAHGLVLVDPSTLRGTDSTELTRVGTPAYAAPEVYSGRFGPPADVYALAATAAALLTGERGEGLLAVLSDPWNAGLPEGVCLGLALDPTQRPRSCRTVLDPRTRLPQPESPPPAAQRTRLSLVAAWWLLALVTVPPLAAWGLGLGDARMRLAIAAAAFAGQLVVQVLTGRPWLGLLAPPAAWAALLGERVRGRPARRMWARTALTGILVGGTFAALAVVLGAADAVVPQVPGVPGAAAGQAAAIGAAALAATVVVMLGAITGAGPGLIPRLLVLPAWAAGAVLHLAGAGFMALARAAGLGAGNHRLARGTLGSLLETFRGPGPDGHA